MSTAAVHSRPAKAKAARLPRAVAEGKATGSGTCGQTRFLYSQAFFQDPCCVETTPPLPTQKVPSEAAVSEDRQTGGAEGAWEEQVEAS